MPTSTPPSETTITTKISTSSALELTWDPPFDDGGRNLTGYYVQHRPAAHGRDNNKYTCDGNEGNKWIHITGADLKLMEKRSRSTHPSASSSFNGNAVRLQSCPSRINNVAGSKANHAYLEVDFHLPFKFEEICSRTNGQDKCSKTDNGYTVSNDGTGDSDYCSWGHTCVNTGSVLLGSQTNSQGNVGGRDCVGDPTTLKNKGWVSIGTPTHLFQNQLQSESSTVFAKTNVLRMTSVQPCHANNRQPAQIDNIDLRIKCAGKQNRSVIIPTVLHCSHNDAECGRVQDSDPSTSWNASLYSDVDSYLIIDVGIVRYIDRIELGWLYAHGTPDSLTASISKDEAMGTWTTSSSWYQDCDKVSGTTFAINSPVRWIKISVRTITSNSGASLNNLIVYGEDTFKRVPTQLKATEKTNERFYGMLPNTLYEFRTQATNAPSNTYVPQEIATNMNDIKRTV